MSFKFIDLVIWGVLGMLSCLTLIVAIIVFNRTTAKIGTIPVPIVQLDNTKFSVERFNNISATLITDNATGCEYFMSTQGVTTPRTYPDGTQFCGQSSYSNVEIDHE